MLSGFELYPRWVPLLRLTGQYLTLNEEVISRNIQSYMVDKNIM